MVRWIYLEMWTIPTFSRTNASTSTKCLKIVPGLHITNQGLCIDKNLKGWSHGTVSCSFTVFRLHF